MTLSMVFAATFAQTPSPATASEPGRYASAHTQWLTFQDRLGEELSVHLTLPADRSGEVATGRFPVVLHYTYFPAPTWDPATRAPMQATWTALGFNLVEGLERLALDGYAVAHIGIPGSGGSQGHFAFDKDRIGRSGYDAVEWLARQPWSDGNVGMYGGSGNGIAQLMTAIQRPPHLRTIIPAVAFQDLYRDTLYRGGMPALGETAMIAALAAGVWGWQGATVPSDAAGVRYLLETLRTRALAAQPPPAFLLEWYAHPTRDEYWDNYTYDVERIEVPVWVWGSWNDHFTTGSIETFRQVGSQHKMLLMGHAGHSLGPNLDPVQEAKRWYDYWLKGDRSNGVAAELRRSPVRYYVEETRTWRSAERWPVDGLELQKLYLTPDSAFPADDGGLGPAAPTEPGVASYLYLPPGGRLGEQYGFLDLGLPAVPSSSLDPLKLAGQLDTRLDADGSVTFVGPELLEDVEVTGSVEVVLHAASTSSSPDWVVTLVDVAPQRRQQLGPRTSVTTGWLRGTHRQGSQVPEAVPRGEVIRYDLAMYPAAHRFRAGHRIGVQIASSDARTVPSLQPALNTIHSGGAWPSSVTLPVRASGRPDGEVSPGVRSRSGP